MSKRLVVVATLVMGGLALLVALVAMPAAAARTSAAWRGRPAL